MSLLNHSEKKGQNGHQSKLLGGTVTIVRVCLTGLGRTQMPDSLELGVPTRSKNLSNLAKQKWRLFGPHTVAGSVSMPGNMVKHNSIP